MTPACAGTTQAMTAWSSSHRDDPRVCGDDQPAQRRLAQEGG